MIVFFLNESVQSSAGKKRAHKKHNLNEHDKYNLNRFSLISDNMCFYCIEANVLFYRSPLFSSLKNTFYGNIFAERKLIDEGYIETSELFDIMPYFKNCAENHFISYIMSVRRAALNVCVKDTEGNSINKFYDLIPFVKKFEFITDDKQALTRFTDRIFSDFGVKPVIGLKKLCNLNYYVYADFDSLNNDGSLEIIFCGEKITLFNKPSCCSVPFDLLILEKRGIERKYLNALFYKKYE